MKAILSVRYTVYSGQTEPSDDVVIDESYEAELPDDAADDEIYLEFVKEFEIDFAPTEGLRLFFHPRNGASRQQTDEYRKLLHEAPELATGIFTIQDVLYDIREGDNLRENVFHLQAYESVETAEILKSIAKQLILGFGFKADNFDSFDTGV